MVGRRHYASHPSKQSTLTAYFTPTSTTSTVAASESVPPSSSADLSAGSLLMLLREPSNQRDSNAIKVFSPALPTPSITAIGHLPARLAAILSPLLDLCALFIQFATITYTPPTADDASSEEVDPLSPHASLPAVGSLDEPMYATLTLSPNPLFLASEHAEYIDRIRRHVSDLQCYAEWSRVDHTHRFIDNFALISSSCLRRFPHLFTEDEQAMVQTFLQLCRPAQHLYCRLMARKQSPSVLMAAVVAAVPCTVQNSAASSACARWFQVSSLRYRHVEDMVAALAELKQPARRSEVAAEGAERGRSDMDSDLPPLLTSPWKYASAGSATTYASVVPSSPFSTSKYPPPSSVDEVYEESAPSGDKLGTANKLKVVRRLQLQSVAEEPIESAQPACAPDSPGFVETSDSSRLLPSELWASLFESMTVKQIKNFCAKLDIRLRSNSTTASTTPSSASTLRASVLGTMQKQRTLSGRCMLDDPRILACLHAMYGQWVRLHGDFLTLCQRLYRLFFLSEDVSHSSIASAQSPMMLEDLGRARWCKPVSHSLASAEHESTAAALFPSRDCFVSWDVSLQLMDVMSYALDDFEAELRAGYVSVPLVLSCLEEAWERLQHEILHETDSGRLQWRVVERLGKMRDVVSAALKTAHLFPHEYEAQLDCFVPHSTPTTLSLPQPSTAAATPSFMLRFRASTSYASVCHSGTAVLERLHRYDEACCLLVNLLQLPYCPIRRGEWWNRLSIDLATNLKHKKRAMAVCQLGMQDEHVRTGDRVELQRRWERLWKDKDGGNGEGLAPAVSSYYVPQPTTASKRGKHREKRAKPAGRGQAGSKRNGGKKRRYSTPASIPVKEDDDPNDDTLHRSSSSPSSSPSYSPTSSPHHVVPASSCITQSTIQGRPTNREVGDKSRLFGYDGQMCSVEELALQYYARSSTEGGGGGGGWKGMHCENALFMSLFALFMWDVIFLPLPAVFPCLYQSAPLDLDDDSFYDTRRSAITAHLRFLSSHSSLREYVSRQWWLHYGERCRGMNWRRWSVDELQEVVDCMGAEAVVGVLSVLARDYQHWVGGLPDLFPVADREGAE